MMLALLASYASAIYLFLLNTFAFVWLSRSRTPASENVTELGSGAVNVEVVEVTCDVSTTGIEKVADLPSQESDITDYTAYSDEATSAIIRQAFLPSKFAEAMKRYGTVNVAHKGEFMDKGADRCSIISSDENASEERFFSDGESATSSSMTSVGDGSEPPDGAGRSQDKGVKDKNESGLIVGGGGKSSGDRRQLTHFEEDESVTDESEVEEFFSFSEESEEPEDTRDNKIKEVTAKDSGRGESKALSTGDVESNVGDENNLENAFCAAVNDPEGDSTPLSSILEKRSRTSCTLSDDLSLDKRCNCWTHEAHTFEATIIHEEVSIELCEVNVQVCITSDGTGKNKSITLSQSQASPSSFEPSEEAEQAIPRIVVHSPSLDEINHQFTPPPPRPCRNDNEELIEVLNFMQECDLEIPNRFLSSAFDDDESDEESPEGDYDTNNDEYDSFSQAKIFMEQGSMPPGSLHLLRVSDDGTYITIEPLDSNESELRLSPFQSMRKVEMTKPAIPTVVVQSPTVIKEMTAQIEMVESTPAIIARTPFVEEVPIRTEVESTNTTSVTPLMKDVVACPNRIEAEVVGPIPSIIIQSPSTEDISIISAGTMSTESEVVEMTPATVGPSPSIEAIITLLDLPEANVVGSASIVESTPEKTDTSAPVIDTELEVVKSTSTPSTVGPSPSIEAILTLLGLPNRGEVGVAESTPPIVSPSSSVEHIHDTSTRAACIEPDSVDFIAPAIIVQSPSLEEIFVLPARTREEIGLSFDIVHSPSMADLASILTDPEHTEVEENEFTPSIASEDTPEETPTRRARLEAEAIPSTPTIVVQSPSMEQIPPRPTHPTRGFDEDITEVLDFMKEHDPMFPTLGEDEEDEDSDSMQSHDSTTISTDSLASFEDEDNDSLKNHNLTTTNSAGIAALASLEDEWKPIFDIINNEFGIPFAKGREFLDKAVEWFENEPKSSWSDESLSQLSCSSSSDGEISDTLDCYASDGRAFGFDQDESTPTNAEGEGVVAVGENTKSVTMTVGEENSTDEGPNGPIPWTLFRPRVAPEDYLRVPERRYKRS